MRKIISSALISGLSAVLWAASPGTAHADVWWGTVATGCIPDEGSLSKLDANSNLIHFKAGQTGDISLHCPVSPFQFTQLVTRPDGTVVNVFLASPQANFFTAASSGDGDGTGTTSSVEVALRSADQGWQNVCAVFSSSSAFQQRRCNFPTRGFSPATIHHFFYVRLHRDTTASDPIFYGIRLGIE
jgi:hypothetical protein